MKITIPLYLFSFLLLFSGKAIGQPDIRFSETPKYDLSKDPVLYTVGYAHLDTEWRWDYQETVNDYLKATLDSNFRFFEKYKGYVFNFTGARRYKMMKEYYPEKYERVKKYIQQNRWFVSGSSVDECDANIPSPESVIRQVLYGNNYFRSEFNRESVDFMLPDCFGFQAHLPSVLAHCGIKGFSTQKLEWGSAVGIPFNIGNWIGPDGKGLVAALNATDYGGNIEKRLDTVKSWVDRVMENGRKYGVYADYRYYGTGDIGGSPEEIAIKNGIASIDNPDSKIHVYLCSSDQLFRDLTEEQKNRLPVYSGDLLLTQHSAGSLTSEAYMKRWNRKNELLAQATEPLAVAANWLGGQAYPQQVLNRAWWLVLGSQMHDILPGTCIPKAYEYAWNDEVLGLNQFAAQLEASAGVVIRAMDTRTKGKAIVVYNSIAIPREDVVEAVIPYNDGTPEFINVIGPDGKEVPSQVLNRTKASMVILFIANVPSFGLACYDVQPAVKAGLYFTGLNPGQNSLENEYYRILVDNNGDISSILDKKLKKEILSAPARLVFQKEHPEHWPAWNMDWNDRKNPPSGFVEGTPRITLVENGPVRIALRIERTARNSVFDQYIFLAAGEAGKRIVVHNDIDWQSKGVSLKASFPLTAANNSATYNLGLGTIERSGNNEKKYEVPSREWFDLTDKTGTFGVTVMEDCKFGSDKPDDKTLRLTLLYTPKTNYYHDQATQDWGSHEVTYGLYSHKGDWTAGKSEWQGRSINQPLRPFLVTNHQGALGKTFSFLQVNTQQVDVRAIKKAENSDLCVIRLQELFGKDAQGVEISLPAKIKVAIEIDGQERKIGDAMLKNGKLQVDMKKFEIRSFAIQLESPLEKLSEVTSIPITIPMDQNVVSSMKYKKNGRFDKEGISIPAEMLPDKILTGGVNFNLGSKADGQNNVMSCKGQKIILPKTGHYNRLYILAAAIHDTSGVFKAGENKQMFRIQNYTGKIGQFDKRSWDKMGRIKGLEKGYIKRDEVAWFSTHVRKDSINIPYQYAYIYKYAMDVSPVTGFLQLPENESIKIFAISVADDPFDGIRPLIPLYDDFSGRKGFSLVPEPRYVKDDMVPAAKISVVKKQNLPELPARITSKDYADMHMPNGVTVRYYYSGAEKTQGAKPENGAVISAANDGMYELLPSDSAKDVSFEQGEGRILMDLQKDMDIDSVNIFSSLDLKRGPQFFSAWALPDKNPVVTGDPKTTGWTYLASITPNDVTGGGKTLYTLIPKKGKPARYRYLMWVTEDSWHGPYYFREVDVFEK
ncbi:MAG: glycosyl hydrolase-related protein [Bacteroidetes bacterium]|nr:glycosyl hydrolase-related protein [Bacteroidota bacterium]